MYNNIVSILIKMKITCVWTKQERVENGSVNRRAARK